MPTAKEIADALRTAKTLDRDALRDIEAYATAQAATGAPTALTETVIHAAGECVDALRILTKRVQDESKERASMLHHIEVAGAAFQGSWSDLVEQNNHTSIVAHEVYRAKRAAFVALLDVFAVVGDRIVATPEEQAKVAADKAEREAAARNAAIEAWCKLDKTAMLNAAAKKGAVVSAIGTKKEIAERLVDAGHRP